MANLNKVVYLSEEQKNTLFTTGSVTANGTTVTYNPNDIYITPPAYDAVPTANSSNLITSGAVYSAISGLSGAMHFRGTTITAIADGSTTNPITINGNDYTAAAGDVVLREVTAGDVFEYVWTGTAWEMLGRDTSFKVTQQAVNTPNASGNAAAFIDTISQDTNGVISVTKKNLDTSGTWNGTATTASKLSNTSKIGDTNKPVYFTANGVPAAIGYEINTTVPSNAVFTDTTYTFASGDANGQIKVTPSSGTAQNINVTGLQDTAFLNSNNFFSLNLNELSNAIDITPTTNNVNLNDYLIIGNYYFTATTTGNSFQNNLRSINNLPPSEEGGMAFIGMSRGSGFLKIFKNNDKTYQLCCVKNNVLNLLTLSIRYAYDEDRDTIWTEWQSLTKDTKITLEMLHDVPDFFNIEQESFFDIWDNGELENILNEYLTSFGYEDSDEDDILESVNLSNFLNKIYQCLIEYKFILDNTIFYNEDRIEGAIYRDIDNAPIPQIGILPIDYGGTGQTSIANIQAGKDGSGNTITSTYLTKAAGVTAITWDNTNKKLTQTINGSTTDIITPYWANLKLNNAASYNITPEMATIKLNGNTSATAASTKNVTLQYDASLEVLNFVFA